MSAIYGCVSENNDCEKKDSCSRVLDDHDGCETTLFKYACNKQNGFQLYIQQIKPTE